MDFHFVDHSIEVLNHERDYLNANHQTTFLKTEERPTKLQEDTEKSVSPY